MLVADLEHFFDLPDEVPAPARRLAEQLWNIVRAATAGDAGEPWVSALGCRRRPGNAACTGRITVLRPEPAAPIHWRCNACGDEGVISNWEGSPFDLRRRRLALAGNALEVVVTDETAATLRGLQLLDPDGERLVFGMRADRDGAALRATAEELEELIGSVAAEANHEPNRRRQRRLDAAFEELNSAAQRIDGH